MMKRIRTVMGWGVCLLLPLIGLGGCSTDRTEDADISGEELITLSFNLYKVSATRADAVTSDPLADGATIRVYAFKAGDTNLTTPLASGQYTVRNASGVGTAIGDLALYRGTYDLYLVSYNSSTNTPALGTGGKITVSNGDDFMYAIMKGVVVQPERAGVNTIQLSLSEPFTRMGAQVMVKVKAKNGTQPITPSTLKANNITITGLPVSLKYPLGAAAWEAASGYADSYTFYNFTHTGSQQVTDWWESTPVVLLPIDGSQMLNFKVQLNITYSNGTLTYTDPFYASVQKVLLPGMTYVFEFSLTFYGILTPTDLTLAVKEYDTVLLSSDGLGG